MRVEYDKTLHNKGLELYKELWPITKPLGRVPHFSLTYNIVRKAVTDMSGISMRVESICRNTAENHIFT
jgi:hypothetical protein